MKNPAFFLIFFEVLIYSCSTQKSNHEKPNIILILADDLGWNQSGCYGSEFYKTPNIDQLAHEGIRFTSAYAAAAVCSPTRASIQTGKYPARLHLTDFIPGNSDTTKLLKEPEWQKFLPLEEKTIAEYLKETGYRTAHFGKWHLSKEKSPPGSFSYNPDKQGYDEFFVTYKPSKSLAQPWQSPEKDGHNVDTITNLAIDFIQRNHELSFFLMVSHNSIHDPLMEKSASIQKFSNHPMVNEEENHTIIGAMIERLDKSVGRIIEQVSLSGIDDNTVIIYFSDNGGRHTYASQKPLKAGKGWLYEGGIRVPLIVRWKGHIKPEKTSDELMSSIDFLPTFGELAGFKIQDKSIDGISLIPALHGKSLSREALFWNYPHYHGSGMIPAAAIRKGDYKLVEWYESSLLTNDQGFELYNVNEDIGERDDLSIQLPELVEELKAELMRWRQNVGAQKPILR
jgi:uncharacterized sulfatase